MISRHSVSLRCPDTRCLTVISRHSLFYCGIQTLTVLLWSPDTHCFTVLSRHSGGPVEVPLRPSVRRVVSARHQRRAELWCGLRLSLLQRPPLPPGVLPVRCRLLREAPQVMGRWWGHFVGWLSWRQNHEPPFLDLRVICDQSQGSVSGIPTKREETCQVCPFFSRISNSDYENHSTFISTSPLGKCPSFTAVWLEQISLQKYSFFVLT